MLAEWHTTAVKVQNIFSKQLLCSFGSNSKLFNATEKILLIYCDSWHSLSMLLVLNKWLSFPTWHVEFQGQVPIPLCTCQINVNMMKPNNDIVFHSFSGLGAAWLQRETSSQCLPHLTTVSSSTNIREQAKKSWVQWQILGTAVFVKALPSLSYSCYILICLAYSKSHYS